MIAVDEPLARRLLGAVGEAWPARTSPPAGSEGLLRVDYRPVDALHAVEADWRDLAQRTIEPNVFAEPEFLIPAMRHLPGGDRASLMCLWREGPGGRPRLVGAMPVVVQRDLFGLREIRAWRPPLSSLGHPLIDAEEAERTVMALLQHLRLRAPGVAGCLMSQVAVEGPFAGVLATAARRMGLTLFAFDRHERAVLLGSQAQQGAETRKRTLKELGRQRRRLEETGPVRMIRAVDPLEVEAAVEHFLSLEAQGWKGRHGTALVQTAGTAALMREATSAFARRQACQVDLLWVGERVIAGAILVRNADRAWFWKVAYDEAFAKYSPGVQLTLAITRDLLQGGRTAMTDSCAVEAHPMIDRLWHDRLSVADIVVALKPHASYAAEAVRLRQAVARRVRSLVKRTYRRVVRTR